MCSNREGDKRTDHPVPALDPKLKRILDRILEEDREVFEELAKL